MTCPHGHESEATDYCDTCGAAMDAGATMTSLPVLSTDRTDAPSAAPAPTPAAPAQGEAADSAARPCPNCGFPNAPDALFCEVCGYDHTTGTLPRSARAEDLIPAAAPATEVAQANTSTDLATPWVAELWIDPAWYAAQGSPDPLPSQAPPAVFALRNTSLLIGRASTSRGIHPDIDCGVDNGVSRRQAQLTTDGSRWWVEDLDSANGTYIGDAVGDLPTKSIPAGQKREVDADDRIYLGSWTRIVLRPSSPDEISALA
ncbi:MAG: FHA domain-containing protein [Nostocoides sp.]